MSGSMSDMPRALDSGQIMMPPPEPDGPPAPPRLIDQVRAGDPKAADLSDYVLARHLYDSGNHGKDESYPAFATRLGVTQDPNETLFNKGLTTAAFGLNNPVEAALAGLGTKLTGGNFGDGYAEKRQELADQDSVGSYQNPKSNLSGNAAGTVADYARFGPVLRAGAEIVPGMSTIAKSGPLGDSIAKFFGLAEANEIPKLIEQQVADPTDTTSALDRVGQVGGGLAQAGAEGVGGALLGHGVGKGLSAVAGPLVSGIGTGLIAADNMASAWPRSVFTKAAETMGKGFTGETTPAQAAHALDSAFYDRLLGNSGMNVSNGVDDLMARMDANPATAQKILKSVQSQQAGQTGTFDSAASNLSADNIGGGVADTKQALQTTVTRLNAEDPSGAKAKDFISTIYGDLIPERLSGPFEWSDGFGNDPTAGLPPKPGVSSTGALINPPVTGTGSLSQALWERLGGGPGRVMMPLMATQPKTAFAGATSLVQQLGTLPARAVGYGLDAAGKGIGAAGEPGTTAADAFSKLFTDGKAFDPAKPFDPNVDPWHQNALQQGVAQMPGAYQTGLYTGADQATNQPNPNLPLFPDTYQRPQPTQHTELPTGAKVQEWLGSTDRGSATNYVAQKLGPDVAQQLAATDDNGFKAALFNIASDPTYRTQLSSASPQTASAGDAGDIPTMTVRPGNPT